MELILHTIHVNAIEQAIAKAKQYRSLLEPEIAESICLDILNIDPNNQAALVIYILALTDQLHHTERQTQIKDIVDAIAKLDSEYQRYYYTGLLNERRALVLISQPMSHSFAYEYIIEALSCYQQAEQLSPEMNDEATLRWNSCIRTIQKEKLVARVDSEDVLIDMEKLVSPVLLQIEKRTLALAGLMMAAYVIIHMLSNLTFFVPTAFNHFYDWYNAGWARWFVLVLMLSAIFIHVRIAIKIRLKNARARTVQYQKQEKIKVPALLVTLSIFFLLAFIIIHIIQTLQFEPSVTYGEVVSLFQSMPMVLFYLAGLFVLMMHLQHSLANVLQTLGKTSFYCQTGVWFITLCLIGGFAAVPLYVYLVL